jgi:hypothetical protein
MTGSRALAARTTAAHRLLGALRGDHARVARGEGAGALGGAARHAHPADGPDEPQRLEVARRLDPRADEGELRRVGARERARRDRAHRGGADGGHRGGVEDGVEHAGEAVEEEDHALVGVEAPRGVVGDDAELLHSEGRARAAPARGHPDEEAGRVHRPPRRPQGLIQLAAREPGERLRHDLDARGHRQAALDLLRAEDQEGHGWVRILADAHAKTNVISVFWLKA